MTTTTAKWDEARTNQLESLVAGQKPVAVETVERAAETLGVTTRSVAAKLRKLGYEVASMAKTKTSAFSPEDSAALSEFVSANAGKFTYAEVAANFAGGKFTAREVQGKLLSLELTKAVKPTPKVEVARTYTDAEQATLVEMAKAGAFVEDIAEKLGKSTNSVRGKALSLLRSGELTKVPAQKESHAKSKEDGVDALGDKIAKMTVAEIAAAVEKTERGIKTLLTRRGLACADYDGASKREKANAKTAA